MSRLFAVELRRILSRRLVRLGVLALFALLVTITVAQSFQHTNDRGETQARVLAQVLQDREMGGGQWQCDESQPTGDFDPVTGMPDNCSLVPVEQEVLERMSWEDPRYMFAVRAPEAVGAGVALAALVGFVLAATSIGAEWQAGTFASLLTWEPRRQRVLLAKTAAAVTLLTVLGALVIAYQVGSAALLAQTRGSFFGSEHVAGELASAAGRGIGLVALVAAGGVALAGIVRHTAGAFAVVAGYLVLVEIALRGMWDGGQQWLLSHNVMALTAGEYEFWVPRGPFGEGEMVTLTAGRAAVVLTVVVALVSALHAWTLHRRDAN